MFFRVVLTVLCALALGCGGSSSPTSTPSTPTSPGATTFVLSGRVSDLNTGSPLASAAITVVNTDNVSIATTSDSSGAYRVSGLKLGGYTVRARYDGFDSVFAGVRLVADTTLDVPMRPAMQTLAGTWAGTLSFSPPTGARESYQIPQLTLAQSGATISVAFFTTSGGQTVTFSGTLRDPASIASTTGVTGTMTLTIAQGGGRNITSCMGTGDFSGSVNWTQIATTAPQIGFDCGTVYTNVTMSLVRQQ